jgi:hypothetical protein
MRRAPVRQGLVADGSVAASCAPDARRASVLTRSGNRLDEDRALARNLAQVASHLATPKWTKRITL